MLNRRSLLAGGAAALALGASATSAMAQVPAQSFAERSIGGLTRLPAAGVGLDAETRAARIAWLQASSAPLRSIDPADAEFSDLEPFAKAIGDARIVMLGEQTHGDGATFLAKCRLVHFLHERMGFDVLAFESGLYDLRKAWEAVRAGENAHIVARRAVFGIWSRSREAQPVFDYVGASARSARPLELAGFDCQYLSGTETFAHEFLLSDLKAFFHSLGLDIASILDWQRFRGLFDRLIVDSNQYTWKPSAEDQRFVLGALDLLRERIPAGEGARASFWRQLLKSMKGQARYHFEIDTANFKITDFNLRDIPMGENLIWLAREAYPRRKIIVWAATFHNARNVNLIHPALRDVVTMGHVAWRALGSEIYNVGFTSYDGATGWVGQTPTALPVPPAGSLEDLWAGTSHQSAFLDFRKLASGGEWLRESCPSRAYGLGDEVITADWPQVFDAVIFIRTMRPSTLIR
jgi:erythromycin esterase